jgi:hypothetical protein
MDSDRLEIDCGLLRFTNSGSGYIGWRSRFLGIDSWAPLKFKNIVSVSISEAGKREGVPQIPNPNWLKLRPLKARTVE